MVIVMLTKHAQLVLQAQLHRLRKTDPDGIVQYIPITRFYQEQNSTFKSNSNVYNLNYIFKAVEDEPVEQIAIIDLIWILKHVDYLDPDRVQKADVSIPILVTKYRNKELVVDGLHRLAKAVNSRMKDLPYKRVSKEVFEASKIKSSIAFEEFSNEFPTKAIPVYTSW